MVDADELRRAFEYVPPLTNDRMFKAIFARRGHEVALVGLLNGLLGYEGDQQVTAVEHVGTHLGGHSHSNKQMLLDLRVQRLGGRPIDPEETRLRPTRAPKEASPLRLVEKSPRETSDPHDRITWARLLGG